jgi:hypothetical protein
LSIIVTFVLSALVLGQTPEVASIELTDQHGQRDSVARHRDEVLVTMVVTASRLRNLKAWERELRERFPELRFVRIADVPQDPPVTLERVANKLAQRVPEEVSVLIDLERRWADELELETDRPNLLLFDRRGRLASAIRGRAEPDLLDRFCADIATILEAP